MDLVERDAELALLGEALTDARRSEGSLLIVEGPAGQGKTALLRELRTQAADAGFGLLSAIASELERDFPFGVIRQLLEPKVRAAREDAEAGIFAGAAELARPLFGAMGPADAGFARLNGLYWMVANLAEEQPVVVVVDDAHWADEPSMRFVDLLARRLYGLPVLVAVGVRPTDPRARNAILDDLFGAPDTRVVRPRPLSASGVAQLLQRALGDDLDAAFVDRVAAATAGNPLLVRELLRTLSEVGFTGSAADAEELDRVLPGSVGRIVRARLARLGADAARVARAVAVLGDSASPREVAGISELAVDAVGVAHAELAAVGLLHPEGLGYVHPLLREATRATVVGAARIELNRRAAQVRCDAGEAPARVAAHLLETDPVGEPWAMEALVDAGRQALLEGAPATARRYLRRALAEPLDQGLRPSVLLALGQAEALTADPEASTHLEEAAGADADTALAANRIRAEILLLHERAGEGAELLRQTLQRPDLDPAQRALLESDLIDLLAHHEPLRDEYLRRLDTASDARPTALAHLAWERAAAGAAATEVVALARRALEAPGGDRVPAAHRRAVEALILVDAADEAAVALRHAVDHPRRHEAGVAASPLTYMPSSSAAWERAFGDLRRAEEEARHGLEAAAAVGAPALAWPLRAALAAILLDRGEIDEAEEQLDRLAEHGSGRGASATHAIRARLRLAQGRLEAALAEAEVEIDLARRRGWALSLGESFHATHCRILVGLGRSEEARRVAEQELATATRRGVPSAEAHAHVLLALTARGEEQLDELRAAAETASVCRRPLVRAEALGALGAALRRAGDRRASREPLAAARDIAHRCGARALEASLHQELLLAGARPRRAALSGVDSLTAAEHRVAELAARGLTNREIAQTLFVSPKTVEVHLGRAYTKLGISGRTGLPGAMAEKNVTSQPLQRLYAETAPKETS